MSDPRVGEVDAAIADELPGLCLRWLRVSGSTGPVGAAAAARLRELSNRRRGIDAVALRTRPVPRAYRAFVRQIGLDPDRDRIPAEQAALRGLMHGGLEARDRIEAACMIAVVETGVGVWALDAEAVAERGPAIRLETPPGPGVAPREPGAPAGWVDDAVGGSGGPVGGSGGRASGSGGPAGGALVIADARAIHAPLFGDPLPGSAPGPRTRALVLFAVGVPGVPEIHLHEALWQAEDVLSASDR